MSNSSCNELPSYRYIHRKKIWLWYQYNNLKDITLPHTSSQIFPVLLKHWLQWTAPSDLQCHLEGQRWTDMGGWRNWTMESETFPCAVTFNSVSLWIISAELSESVHPARASAQTQPSSPCQSIRLWKCVQLVSPVQRGNLKAPGVNTHDVKYAAGTCWECWYRGQPLSFFLSQWTWNCGNLTEEPCNFIGFLLLNLLIIQSFKEDVQDQYIFSGGRGQTRAHQRDFISGDTALD